MTGTNLIGDAAGVKALRGERFRSTQGRTTSLVEDDQYNPNPSPERSPIRCGARLQQSSELAARTRTTLLRDRHPVDAASPPPVALGSPNGSHNRLSRRFLKPPATGGDVSGLRFHLTPRIGAPPSNQQSYTCGSILAIFLPGIDLEPTRVTFGKADAFRTAETADANRGRKNQWRCGDQTVRQARH